MFAKVVGDGLGSFGHGLDEFDLFVFGVPAGVGVFGLAARVDVGLAVSRGDADGLVFEVGAKATHGMTLAVSEVEQGVVGS